ncbi:MAG: tetratricopeptide repeat protein, partial [Planctomycetota bacterium]
DTATARMALSAFPEEDERRDEADRLRSGIEWLEAKLDAAGPPAERLMVTARQRLLARDTAGAMQALLESVQSDKNCRGGLARKGMLLCFAIVGEAEEALDDYRRRLATLLY